MDFLLFPLAVSRGWWCGLLSTCSRDVSHVLVYPKYFIVHISGGLGAFIWPAQLGIFEVGFVEESKMMNELLFFFLFFLKKKFTSAKCGKAKTLKFNA